MSKYGYESPMAPHLGSALNPVVGDAILAIVVPGPGDELLAADLVGLGAKEAGVGAEAAAARAADGVATDLKPLGRGSTGRTEPNSLNEKLAMESAMSNPGAGQVVPLRKGMTDPRWPGSDGWVKMTQNVNGIEIHYVMNRTTGQVDDFKFKG
jgi:hypothetical protein